MGPMANVEWLEQRVAEAMASRAAPQDGFSRGSYDIVFLFDSSQAGGKSGYRAQVQSVIEEFLKRRAREPGGTLRSFAVHPYQVSFYPPPNFGMSLSQLNEDNIAKVEAALPNDRLITDPQGRPLSNRGGHDHSGARREAFTFYNQGQEAGRLRPLIMVQFTTVPFNELPGSPRDAAERRRDARTAFLEESGLEAYDVPGLPLFTEAPDSFPVYCWVYGPSDYSRMTLVNTAPTVKTQAPKEVLPPRRFPFGTILGALAALGGVAAAIWWLLKPIPVRISAGNTELFGAHVRRGQKIAICGPGTKSPGNPSLVLTDSVAPGVPSDRLAHIVIPWFSTAYVEGGLYNVQAANVKANRLSLERTRSFTLKSKIDGLQTSALSAKIG